MNEGGVASGGMQTKRPRPSELRGSAHEECRYYGGADEVSAGGREECERWKSRKVEKWKSEKMEKWTTVSQWQKELGKGERANEVAK